MNHHWDVFVFNFYQKTMLYILWQSLWEVNIKHFGLLQV